MTTVQVHGVLGEPFGAETSGPEFTAVRVEWYPRHKLHVIYDVGGKLARVERVK